MTLQQIIAQRGRAAVVQAQAETWMMFERLMGLEETWQAEIRRTKRKEDTVRYYERKDAKRGMVRYHFDPPCRALKPERWQIVKLALRPLLHEGMCLHCLARQTRARRRR